MIFSKTYPRFDLGEYVLREHEDRDLQDFFDYYTDPIVNEYILADIPKDLEGVKYEFNYWKNIFYNNQGIYFTVAKKSDDRMVGSIGLTSYNSYHNRIELSYDMAKEYWQKGIMSSASKVLTKYTFEELKINRLDAVCSTYNEPSMRLLEKCGFEYEGKLRQHRFHRGKYVDIYSYSIVRDDYLKDPEKYNNIRVKHELIDKSYIQK